MRYFRDRRQRRLFVLLLAASVFCGILVVGRAFLSNTALLPEFAYDLPISEVWNYTFLFLIWNLFLAWIPYWVALQAEGWQRRGGAGWGLLVLGLVWLAFFPNAPYIVTDFMHLRNRPPVPLWYDLMTLFTAAITGLTLGLMSLYEIQLALRQRFSARYVWVIKIAAIGLCGFGIWMGRFQRYNSWDIVTRPIAMLVDLAQTLATRQAFFQALGISVLFSGLLLLGYALLLTLLEPREGA
jgi:uncharacterized membrane protein